MQKKFAFLLWLGAVLLVLYFVVHQYWRSTVRIESPPMVVPISLEKAGVAAEFGFSAAEKRVYQFFIRFRYKEKDEASRTTLKQLLGGYEVDKNGSVINRGAPMPVALTILSREEDKVLFRKRIDPALTSWGAGFFDKNIGSLELPPGKYVVRLEIESAVPGFFNTPVEFVVGFDEFKIN